MSAFENVRRKMCQKSENIQKIYYFLINQQNSQRIEKKKKQENYENYFIYLLTFVTHMC